MMQTIFTSHFLEPNEKPLKTECVLHMVGRGTKQAWKSRNLVEPSETSYRATNTLAQWLMVLEVWNVSFKRACQLHTEFSNRLQRNS